MNSYHLGQNNPSLLHVERSRNRIFLLDADNSPSLKQELCGTGSPSSLSPQSESLRIDSSGQEHLSRLLSKGLQTSVVLISGLCMAFVPYLRFSWRIGSKVLRREQPTRNELTTGIESLLVMIARPRSMPCDDLCPAPQPAACEFYYPLMYFELPSF